jgi:hypothetical protein
VKKGKGKRESPASSSRGLVTKLLQMQKQMRKTRADLAGETVTATSVDGTITVVVGGDQRVQQIRIAPELLQNGDSEMFADLLTATINDAMEKSQTLAANRLQELTGGLGLPGQ